MTSCNQIIGGAVLTLCCITLALGLCGCSSGAASPQAAFQIKVSIDDHPVESVRVALAVKGDQNNSIVLEGITDFSGVAPMLPKEGAELASTPTEYTVICESLGDWQIKQPWSELEKSPLTLTWPSSEPLSIELPAKAIRSL